MSITAGTFCVSCSLKNTHYSCRNVAHFPRPKGRHQRYFSREILMFFAEQKPIWNHRVTQLVLVALGKNTMFLAALLARKSRRGRVLQLAMRAADRRTRAAAAAHIDR